MRRLIHPFAAFSRRERGSSAVEFALVVPAFLLLVFGVIDFGLGVWTNNNLSQAVREGARYAIVRGAGSDIGMVGPGTESATCGPVAPNLNTVAGQVCRMAFPLDPSKLTVTANWSCGVGGDPDACSNDFNRVGQLMKVSAEYEYTPFVNSLIPITITLSSTSRMQIACCNN